MKCAFINLGKHYGGAETYLICLAENWIKIGNECVFIVREGSIFEKRIRNTNFSLKTVSVRFNPSSIDRVKKILEKEKVDLFHVNGINSGVFMNFLNLHSIPRITTVHSDCLMDRTERPKLIRNFYKYIENYCLKKSDAIIAVSNTIKELLVHRGIKGEKVEVIYNGIKRIDYPQKEYRLSNKEPLKICYLGRLEKVKGCEYLLTSLSQLRDIEYKCDIWGDGILKKELAEMSKNLGISDFVKFKGFSQTVRDNLFKYDLMIQPSIFEAFPLTLLEAMNARTEIICSKVGGMREIITDGETGWQFDVGDIECLSQIIRNIYNYPLKHRKIAENAYKKYLMEFTEELMVNKTFEIFRKVVNK